MMKLSYKNYLYDAKTSIWNLKSRIAGWGISDVSRGDDENSKAIGWRSRNDIL